MENQEEIWDNIAEKWDEYRQTPSPSVIEFLENKKGKILDLGCGSGRNFCAFNKTSQIYCADFSKEMLRLAEKNACKLNKPIIKINAKSDKLEFQDNSFDSAICVALLHCIKSQKQRQNTLNELYRVLKPKSQCLITVWSKNSKRLKNKPKESYIPWTIEIKGEQSKQERFNYIYDKQELEQEVKQAGFKIIKSWEERNINIISEKSQ